MSTTEEPDREITAERLRRELAALGPPPDSAAPDRQRRRPARPRGLLTSMESWTSEHEAAAARSVLATLGQPGAAASPFLTILLGALAELMQAYLRTADTGLDALLELRPPLVTPRTSGLARCGLLTPVTDRDALIRDLFGRVPGRPRYVKQEPTVPVEIGRSDTEEIRELLGLSVAEMAEIYRARTLTSATRRLLLGRVLPRMLEHDPGLAAAMQDLFAQAPTAVAALPTADLLFALVRGVRRPGRRIAHQFVQTVELGAHGIVAMVSWNPSATDRRPARTAAAGHVRYIADFAVAPWNRWSDLRRRREALCLTVAGSEECVRGSMISRSGSDGATQTTTRSRSVRRDGAFMSSPRTSSGCVYRASGCRSTRAIGRGARSALGAAVPDLRSRGSGSP